MGSRLGDPMRELSREINGVPKALLLDAVKAVKRVADEEAARDVGGDLQMSNLGRASLKLRDDLQVGSGQASVTLKPPRGSAGAWALATWGAKPHVIGDVRSRGRGKAKRIEGPRLLSINGNVRRGPVSHPGARGKGTFERVLVRAPDEVVKACEKALTDALRKF